MLRAVVGNSQLIKGKGKSVVLVHGNSTVTVNGYDEGPDDRSVIDGYYFEVNVSASNLTVENSTLHQKLVGDSHAAMYVTSTYSTPQASTVQMTNVTFDLETGRPIVTGNTNTNGVTSFVTLTSPKLKFGSGTAHRGLLNYDSGASTHIKLTLNGSPMMWNWNGNAGVANTYYPPNIVDIVTTVAFGNYTTAVTDPNTPPLPGYSQKQVALGRFVQYGFSPQAPDDDDLIYPPSGMVHESVGTAANTIFQGN